MLRAAYAADRVPSHCLQGSEVLNFSSPGRQGRSGGRVDVGGGSSGTARLHCVAASPRRARLLRFWGRDATGGGKRGVGRLAGLAERGWRGAAAKRKGGQSYVDAVGGRFSFFSEIMPITS